MILENAFGYLPEILTGSNYAAQEYEGGIVAAIALAALQELNARNIPNPISNLCIEKLYDPNGFDRGEDASRPRYLRADLHVDLSRVWVGSRGLARFGWRHRNWVEAKFLRRKKIPSTTACALVAADLLRLCALVPPESRSPGRSGFTGPLDSGRLRASNLCTGRYFLHVYDADPELLVGKKGRPWIKALRNPGSQRIHFKVGDDNARADFVARIGDGLQSADLRMRVTNFCHGQGSTGSGYRCVLTRIDSFTIAFEQDEEKLWYRESNGRSGRQSSGSALLAIRKGVGSQVLLGSKVTPDKGDTPPSDDELTTADLEEPVGHRE